MFGNDLMFSYSSFVLMTFSQNYYVNLVIITPGFHFVGPEVLYSSELSALRIKLRLMNKGVFFFNLLGIKFL